MTQIRTNLEGFEQKFCFAVQEGNKELLSKLNEGLAIVNANGEFNDLYVKWFSFLVQDKMDPIEVLKTSLMILTPVLILIILVGAVIIRKRIRQKEKALDESNRAILNIEAHLRLQQKLEAIGVLAGGVAHEINNPINGVMNYGQIIYDITRDREDSYISQREQVQKYSEEIINESNRIANIVSNLLQFSRKNSNQHHWTEPDELIEEMLSLVKSVIKRDQIEIIVNKKKDLPMIDCNEMELQQVLLNLIVNAKDSLNAKYEGYHEDKLIIISTDEIVLPSSKAGVRITVEDHGGGIPEDVRDRIFDPFFSTKGRTEGMGLGLSISYNIVNDHGGIISFETKDGQYTRFHIELPVGETDR